MMHTCKYNENICYAMRMIKQEYVNNIKITTCTFTLASVNLKNENVVHVKTVASQR